MNRKKIIFTTNNLRMGGANKILIDVLENININKYEVQLIITDNYDKANFFKKNIPSHIPYLFLKSKRWTAFIHQCNQHNKSFFYKLIYNTSIKQVDKFLTWMQRSIICRKIGNIDVWIDFSGASNVRTIWMKNIFRPKKKIIWLHSNIANSRRNQTDTKLRDYDYIVTLCQEMREVVANLFPFLQKKLITIYNLLNFQQILQSSTDDSTIKEIEKNALKLPYFIAVSRLDTSSKDYYTLLQAVQILKKRGIQEKLYIVGEGSDRSKIEGWIQEMDLTDQVKLLGLQKNPYIWMKHAQFLVHSSKSEGLPTVLIEAMILGKYVISSDCPTGPKEILENGKIGTLVKVGDALGFADAIAYQIKNPASAEILKKIEKSIQRFEASNVMKEYEKVIDL